MKSPQPKRLIQELLDHVGVQIDGQAPWDIQVHNPDFYHRLIAGGSLALGESYMDGWWDCQALDQFFERILAARLDKKGRKSNPLLMASAKARLHPNAWQGQGVCSRPTPLRYRQRSFPSCWTKA